MAYIETIRTGCTLVSPAVPDRSTKRFSLAYTGLFQKRSSRIRVPVKCFYVEVANHHFLVDAGWSREVVSHPLRQLGFGLWFASEPVMREEEAAVNQLRGRRIDAILMTHLDCDHVCGLTDFSGIPVYASGEEIAYAKRKRIRYGRLPECHEYRRLPFREDSSAPFGKSADVFGDGSVIAYLTPTHSAGSVIYKVSEGERFALIVGDNGYKEDSWKKGLLPGPLYNASNMKKCLAWINSQSLLHSCIGIYCAHDPIDR